ncbi:putative U3 small nucleolar RNA-associated protein 11 [Silene latifolia]|uniref:putative U3 small nucleolar RNA-associated protein 11 n=1 Tax=Silene latifolia TaxID=37657 RepID=UPI003D7726FE
MSSIRNSVPKRPYKERSQPASRKKFGLLEKHKDYVIRAQNYHKKEEILQRLREKAANKNPDEFYFGMCRSKTVNGKHRALGEANKYTPDELLLMKTQDIGYVLQKIQSEKKKVEKLRAVLHSLDDQPSKKHIYFAEDSEEANEIQSRVSENDELPISGFLPPTIKRKMESSYRELEARMLRVKDLERVYAEMAMQKELQKKGKKRKLREDEVVNPTSRPVYKWKAERKR